MTNRHGEHERGSRRNQGEATAAHGEYVWDIHGYDTVGDHVVAWIGLRMRDARPLWPDPAPSPGDTPPIWPGRSEARAACVIIHHLICG
jgi:hypothetical protein